MTVKLSRDARAKLAKLAEFAHADLGLTLDEVKCLILASSLAEEANPEEGTWTETTLIEEVCTARQAGAHDEFFDMLHTASSSFLIEE